ADVPGLGGDRGVRREAGHLVDEPLEQEPADALRAAFAEARKRADQRFALRARRGEELALAALGRVETPREPRRAALRTLDQGRRRRRRAFVGREALAFEPITHVRAKRFDASLDVGITV